MIPIGSFKKESFNRANSGRSRSEFEGIVQILEESKNRAVPNFDNGKGRQNHLLPPNDSGEIEFTGMNQSAKFVRLPNTASESNIQTILQTKWDLSHPTLVISIFGGDFEKKRKLKMIIKKGLWKAAESAGCWIITEGVNMGIMKLAGEAVRDYTDAYGGNKMICIGVSPWHGIAKIDVLENALSQGTNTAIYQSEEETENHEDGNNKEKNKDKSLDPNHSYFFLYDKSSMSDNCHYDVQFRTQLEHAISVWKPHSSNYEAPNEIRVPICGLIVGGDILTLNQVFHSIIENKCPVVACQGSSGAADVIALALDAYQKFDMESTPDDQENAPLESRLESIIRECLYKINPEIKEFKKESLQLKEIVTNLSYLISVFDMEEDWDLDGYIISSLLSSAGSDIGQNQLNLEQLEITLTLNRADIAKEKIFLENKKWKKGDLNDYMFNALMSDRHDFVKLFLEQGFSLEEFLTIYILEKLYTEQIKNMDSRTEIFHQIWEHYRTHRLVQNVKLREVGKVIKILVGDFYHPLYLSKDFQSLYLQPDKTSSTIKKSIKSNSNKSVEKLINSNLKVAEFNEYKMFVFSLYPHSRSLLHLNYIDQMDMEGSGPLEALQYNKNFSYENSGMEDEEMIDGKNENLLKRNSDFDTTLVRPNEKMPSNKNNRRASSLDMIDMLNQYKLNLSETDDKYEIAIKGFYKRSRNISEINDLYKTDQTISSETKSSISSVPSRKHFVKHRNDKLNNQTNTDEMDEEKLKQISLERPARELMIWSILVGKLQMAELFWTMEKEQIAGGLLASMLLSSMANKTDDFTDKEDYKSYSKHFESQAEGVLNECYIEDEKRAQCLINKELKYYGRSSVILLAAQGQCIKFMAHPCCQDFLTSTWYGDLSSKNSILRILASVGLGLTIPFLIPKVIMYKEEESSLSPQLKQKDCIQNPVIGESSKDDVEIGSRYMSRKSRFIEYSKPRSLKLFQYFTQIKSFYFSPIVRFIYNAASYVTFLLLFSTFILFKFKVEFVFEEVVLTFWIGTLLLEEIKQIFSATFSGISFSTYFSDGWNKLDSSAITLFVLGFIFRFISYTNNKDNLYDINQQYHIILKDPLFITSQTCMGCSLFIFYVRVMYIFSFHIALGPKLIMIRKMISNDLIPFMIILSVFMIGYGVTAYANAYPLGLQFNDDMLKNTSYKFTKANTDSMFMTILLKSYYPMFGDFGLDNLQGNIPSSTTGDINPMPTKISRTLIPLFLGLHVLLTNVLLFNLLIAMFTKTYEEIESSSVYYWNYQRYQMISEFVNKSPLVPPFIIFWHVYEACSLIKRRFLTNSEDRITKSNTDPFCINFSEDMKKERELVKWEHMKAMDYIRKLNEPTHKSRQTRGADGRSLVFRGMGSAGAAASALVPQIAENKTEMSNLSEEINHQLDKRFKEVDVKLAKMNDIEIQVLGLSDAIKNLGTSLTDIKSVQNQILDTMQTFPKCLCTETINAQRTKTEEENLEDVMRIESAVKSAIMDLKSELQPLIVDHSVTSKADKGNTDGDESEQTLDFIANDDMGDAEKDPIFVPQVENTMMGRLLERVVNNHRLWRYLPFNFEVFPGMRMKVPNNMVSWQIPFFDYHAFDAGEETLLYPNEHCHDLNDPANYKDSYNNYDQTNKVRRQSMLGQYAIDPLTDAPLNPTGRTGLKDKGLLPHWGPNHSIIILFTRLFRTENGSPIHRKSRNVMQYIALERSNRFGIPWFLIDHLLGCDLNECSQKTAWAFLNQRLEAQFSSRKIEFIRKKIVSSTCTQIFKGFLDDQLNSDNAWVETVVINFHESEKFLFTDDLLKIFAENHSPENVKWSDVTHSPNTRLSHNMILKIFSQKMNSFF